MASITSDAGRAASPKRWSAGRKATAIVLGVVVAFGICEALGWPFLAGPIQTQLGKALQRKVSLTAEPGTGPSARIHLLGGLSLTAPYIEIGAPAWSSAPHMMLARDASLTLGYADLWRASRGEPLRIRELKAGSLDSHIERLADGRATWQFGKKSDTPDTDQAPTRVPVFGRMQVKQGTLTFRDALVDADMNATFSLVDGTNVSRAGLQKDGSLTGFVFDGDGHYKDRPAHVSVRSNGVLTAATGDKETALPVRLDAKVGGAALKFDGTATDVMRLTALTGRFTIEGSSLAAVGEPLHVTLPATPPFEMAGGLKKDGNVWNVVVDGATIGSSRLAGAFQYDPTRGKPLLSGRLTGPRLVLADLGPSVGAPTGKGTAPPPSAKQRSGRVLPDKAFDLPSLRAMNANVLIDIASLDLGTSLLTPFQPLRTHLVLQDGVLTLQDIVARTAQGELDGTLQLDGRKSLALWKADLRLVGVRLETFLHEKTDGKKPPYISGSLYAQTRLAGEGKSTAAILGSLNGSLRINVRDGSLSHLITEVAGLDVAQSLGVLLKGDDALPLTCSVADVKVDKGVLAPKLLVLDNRDSTIWIGGSISLASEAFDLRAVSDPKDFSPLSLRTPVLVKGTFGEPHISVEKGKLAGKAGLAAVLGIVVAPIAAIVPLFDFGDKNDAAKGAAACEAAVARMARTSLPPPAPASGPASAARANARPTAKAV